jgi:hypothetical protein
MSDLGTLLLRLAADAGQFESDLGRAARIAEKRGQEIEKRFKQVGAVIGTAFVAAAGALTGLTKQAIDTADKFALMSQKVGVSVESLSTLTYAAQQSGVQVDQLQGGMVKLAKNASDAAMGVGTAVNGFDALGISVKNADGSLKGTDKLLAEIATQFSKYEDGANKTALAVNLFGRAGAELIPLLNEGAGGIEKLQERAKELGLQISGETAAHADAFNDLLDDMGALAKGVGNDIARELLPSLTQLAENAVNTGVSMRNAGEGSSVLADALKVLIAVAYTVKSAIEAVVNTIAAYVDVAAAAGRAALEIAENTNPVTMAFKAARGELRSFTTIASEFKTKAASAMMSSTTGVKDAVENLAEAMQAIFAPIKNTGAALGAGDAGSGGQGLAPAMRNVAGASAEAEKAMKELEKQAEKSRKAMQDVAVQGVMRLVEELEQMEEVEARLAVRFADQERDLRNEIRLLGLTGEARAKARREIEAENMARDENGDVIRAQAAEFEDLLAQYDRAAQDASQAQAFESAWTGAIGNIATAFGDWVVNGFKDFSSFVDNVKNTFKRMIADLIAQMVQSGLMRMVAGLFGGGFSGAAAAGTGGGGFNLSSLTSLFGGGGSGGMGGMFSSAMPWLAAAGAAYAGYNMHQGQSAGTRLGAAATYGTLGYVGGTVALGAGLGAAGAAAGAGTAAAAGGAATGAMGAAAAIPIVGWVLAAIAAVDWATGGRVMGTDYRPERYNSTLGVGENGAVARASVDEWRYTNANPFRDFGNWGLGQRRSRTRNLAAPDELTRAADQFYQTQIDVAKEAARRFRAEVGPLIEGTFTQVLGFTKKGKRDEKKDKTFAEIMGRRYEGISQEEFAMRMSGFQLLSQIANNLTSAQIGEGGFTFNPRATGGPGRPGNREFRDIFEDTGEIGEGLSEAESAWQASLDAIMSIAAQWDDNAEMFAQGAEFLLAAAVDIHNGVGLLGEGGTLAEITELVQDLGVGAETLGQTYARLVAQTSLFESALQMMGVSLDLGREEFVLFANDISEAAGGVERASQLWDGYFNRFYTETERAALALDRVTTHATTAFEEIGLSVEDFTGSEGLEAFRTLFESTMPTLTAEQVVAWLTAAETLGLVIDATAFYNQALLESAGTVVTAAATMSAAMTELDRVIGDMDNLIPESGGLPLSPSGPGGGPGGLPGPDPRDADYGSTPMDPAFAEFMAWFEQRIRDILNPPGTTPPPIGGGSPEPSPGPGDIDREIERRYQMELDWLHRLMRLQDSLLLDPQLSTLTPAEMLAEAERQYEAALAGSMAGDERSREIFDAATRGYLEQARNFYASSDAYQAIFDRVTGNVGSLIAASPANDAASIVASELTAASSLAELKGLREDSEDQTEALVLAIADLQAEAKLSRDVQTQMVIELRRLAQSGGRVA